jgi:hypothetical protein
MRTKKYSSYAQIERELEILKIEKELSLQKLRFEIEGMKENLEPKNILRGLIGSYMPTISGPYGKIIGLALPFIKNFIFKKRGR